MVEVLKQGMFTTIQDLGREGYRAQGVPVSGAMDLKSAMYANMLVQNETSKAVIETTLMGPTLQFHKQGIIALTGAFSRPKINNKDIAMYQKILVHKGDTLQIGNAATGVRTYLAIKGGFNTAQVLGSRSFYAGITQHKALLKGMQLHIGEQKAQKIEDVIDVPKTLKINYKLSCFKGPEYHILIENGIDIANLQQFTIDTRSNRMGILIKGLSPILYKEQITVPVIPGTVQLTPSGTCIVVMRDGQTTGGYPRILQLTTQAVNELSQIQPGKKISYNLVS